jgi:hypothetical protein
MIRGMDLFSTFAPARCRIDSAGARRQIRRLGFQPDSAGGLPACSLTRWKVSGALTLDRLEACRPSQAGSLSSSCCGANCCDSKSAIAEERCGGSGQRSARTRGGLPRPLRKFRQFAAENRAYLFHMFQNWTVATLRSAGRRACPGASREQCPPRGGDEKRYNSSRNSSLRKACNPSRNSPRQAGGSHNSQKSRLAPASTQRLPRSIPPQLYKFRQSPPKKACKSVT